MGLTTIEWADATFNPIGGCSIRSPGCKPCYAMKLAGTRLKHHPLYKGTTSNESGRPVFNGKLTVLPDDHPAWTWPVGWRGASNPRLGPGKPSLIFVGDMSDLFHESRPQTAQDKVVGSILHSRHIGQLLTKRPDVMADYIEGLRFDGRWDQFPHPITGKNFEQSLGLDAEFYGLACPRLWLGMSAERQKEFDERWPHLRRVAEMGFTVFVSYEPAMGPLVLPDDFLALGRRAQIIAGGVSGHWPWAPHIQWFRRVRDQCAPANVAFFFKQWGTWAPHKPAAGGDLGDDVRRGLVKIVHPGGETDVEVSAMTGGRSTLPGSHYVIRLGKKKSGHLLDGREHREFPRAA